MEKVVVWISAVVIVAVAILALWLGRDPTPELPPLRPLTEPSYKTTPIPETTKSLTPDYVDDSTTDVFIVGGN